MSASALRSEAGQVERGRGRDVVPVEHLVDGEHGEGRREVVARHVVGDRHRGRAVRHEVAELGAGGRGVDGHEHGTGAQDAEQSLDRLEAGPGTPQDTLARGHAGGGQSSSRPGRALGQGGAVEHPAAVPAVDQHGGAGASGPAGRPHVGQGAARRNGGTGRPAARRNEGPHQRPGGVIV